MNTSSTSASSPTSPLRLVFGDNFSVDKCELGGQEVTNMDASDISFPNGSVDYSKVHDSILAIDPVTVTVTLNLVNGFSFGRPVWYISI
jgi:hypothetical protein